MTRALLVSLLAALGVDRTKAIHAAVCVILISSALALVELWGNEARDLFAYDRALVEAGQLWRLLTASYVHLSPQHTFLNIVSTIIIIAAIVEAASIPMLVALVAAGSVSTGVGLHLFAPSILHYVGFSGALYAILAGGGLAIVIRGPSWAGILILIYVGGRLTIDLVFGPSEELIQTIGGEVVVASHICGAVGGILCSILMISSGADRLRRSP